MPRILALFAFLSISSAHAQDPLALPPDDPASPVHPRRFGLPGGVGVTRGWYVWEKFDAKNWSAEVRHEASGEKYKVRVLPWLTTYRHLAYGAHPDQLLPGERVNLFFNPDDKQKRAYLVHFQDEIGQMKGHNHAWRVLSADDKGFTARVFAGDKPLDDTVAAFTFDSKVLVWRKGKTGVVPAAKVGENLYLTWVYHGKHRIVHLMSDVASLPTLQAEAKTGIDERVRREGVTGFIDEITADKAKLLVFATWWAQTGDWKPGQKLRLFATDATYQADGDPIDVTLTTRKNLGTYGSGCTECVVGGLEKAMERLSGLKGNKVIRVLAAK
ncbi:MAG: hypothetical protein U0793_06600 [Gemmataceae bacterium]